MLAEINHSEEHKEKRIKKNEPTNLQNYVGCHQAYQHTIMGAQEGEETQERAEREYLRKE